jgi:hypothetical protein
MIMIEKKKVIITNVRDLLDYEKKGYNSEQIINVSNNTTESQQQQNTGQWEGGDQDKAK